LLLKIPTFFDVKSLTILTPRRSGEILSLVDMIMVSKRNGGMRMVTTIRLPEELHKKLKTEARAKGMTLNGLVVWVLWEWVRR